jgi:hypothetical protein
MGYLYSLDVSDFVLDGREVEVIDLPFDFLVNDVEDVDSAQEFLLDEGTDVFTEEFLGYWIFFL